MQDCPEVLGPAGLREYQCDCEQDPELISRSLPYYPCLNDLSEDDGKSLVALHRGHSDSLQPADKRDL